MKNQRLHFFLSRFIFFILLMTGMLFFSFAGNDLMRWKNKIPEMIHQVDKMRAAGNEIKGKDFLVIGDTLFISPDGTNYLFRWDERSGRVVRIDSSRYHGYNFSKYLFTWNNRIFSFGGYGFWQSHMLLTEFDQNSHGWKLILTSGAHPKGKQYLAALIRDDLYIIGVINSDEYYNSGNQKEQEAFLYRLNLKTLEWQKMKGISAELKMLDGYVYAENDRWFVANELIVDKLHKKIIIPKIIPQIRVDIIRKDNLGIVAGDQFLIYTLDSLSKEPLRYSIPQITSQKNTLVFPMDEPDPESARLHIIIPVSIAIFLALISLWGLWYRAGRKRRSGLTPPDNQEILTTLATIEKRWISQEELDVLLKIDYLTPDSKKQKRSQLLKQIDASHPGLILRERNTEDKRKFDYGINRDLLKSK